jgi:hypothetical protein
MPRKKDICVACNEEHELVGRDLCRACYQKAYREQEAGRIKHGLTKKARKLRQNRLKCIADGVKFFDRADELGLLDEWPKELADLIQTLVQYLVAKQKEIIGKPLDDLLDERLSDDRPDETTQ